MAVGPATSETVYEPVPYWAKIPHGIWLQDATATATAVVSGDRVYFFNRGNMPVLVFDRDGDLVDVYAAEVSYVEVGSKLTPPRELVSLRKWRRAKG
jgi:hypothetical protein